jgi:hypothetical protein
MRVQNKVLLFVFASLLAASACRGTNNQEGNDAGVVNEETDAGLASGCEAIDCGPGAVCDESVGTAICMCPQGTCGGGAQCVVESGVSICSCLDGSLYQGQECNVPVGTCPPGMTWINPNTCIDSLEFSVNEFLSFLNSLGRECDDPGPTCTACKGRRCFPSDASNPWHYDDDDETWWIEGQVGLSLEHPARFMTFDAAKQACESTGKRLCKPDEWGSACAGLSNRSHPYGNEFEEGRCKEGGQFAGRPWVRGESADCASIEHPELRDQSGNVWEWTDRCSGDRCYVRGGSYAVDGSFFPDALGCEFDQGHERDSAQFDIGFRCCASPL